MSLLPPRRSPSLPHPVAAQARAAAQAIAAHNAKHPSRPLSSDPRIAQAQMMGLALAEHRARKPSSPQP